MCGVAGIFIPGGAPNDALHGGIRAMTERLHHRGPDGGDTWLDADAGIALGQRRLAIIDLSPAGAQPMQSKCGRYAITYNGEIYNAAEMRAPLEDAGLCFRGHSDTEVLLEAIARYGVLAAVRRTVGMFAFAVWDRKDRTLTLVRDRLGIKPLYWGPVGGDGTLGFASELSAFAAHPAWRGEIDRRALSAYLQLGYVPAPLSIWRGIAKLAPGTMLTIAADGSQRTEAFWSLPAQIANLRVSSKPPTAEMLAPQIKACIADAVKCRLVSDVPLGAFLSGGIDSSLVAAHMQEASTRPVKTYSIGFEDAAYNEADYAAAVARRLGTDHTELTISEAALLDMVPDIPSMHDEPFADSSSIPTHALSKLTRAEVTVALSGDGGDELFAGYHRYLYSARVERWRNRLPGPARALAAGTLKAIPPSVIAGVAGARGQGMADRVTKFANALAAADADAAYGATVRLWHEGDPADCPAPEAPPPLLRRPEERMQYFDMLTYLPDDILTKVDRMSMAVALEVRVPLLDHRLVGLAWQLPFEAKLSGGVGKRILRDILAEYLPADLIDRPKMGFAVPLRRWLSGPLREWAETLVADTDWQGAYGLAPETVRRDWQGFVRAGRPNAHRIWSLLALAGWGAGMASTNTRAAAA